VLRVEKFLKSKGVEAALAHLAAELGIKVRRHDTLPLAILNYDQIKSPKAHRMVQECRGLVIDTDTGEVVARPFRRFFNVGERRSQVFDWEGYTATAKEDGTLIILYCYKGQWIVGTRGTFGDGKVYSFTMTWRDLFFHAVDAHLVNTKLDAGVTYLFELCSPYNKIVRHYPTPVAYLIGAVYPIFGSDRILDVHDCEEWELDMMAQRLGFSRPERFHNISGDSASAAYVEKRAAIDPTWEGLVLRDTSGRRLKLKTTTYVALHHMFDNGNVLKPSRLLDVVLNGEIDEVASKFPEIRHALEDVDLVVRTALRGVADLWLQVRRIEDQKAFALKVKDHPLSAVLFQARKQGLVHHVDVVDLAKTMPDLLAKKFLEGRVYEPKCEVKGD
jgi:hypothetical protein